MLSFVTIVDPNYCTCEGENLAEGSQHSRVDDSCWRNDERTHDEHDSEDDERGRETKLMFHNSASCLVVDTLVFVKVACCCQSCFCCCQSSLLLFDDANLRNPTPLNVHLCPPTSTYGDILHDFFVFRAYGSPKISTISFT